MNVYVWYLLFTQDRRYALFTEIFCFSNSEIGVVILTEFGPVCVVVGSW